MSDNFALISLTNTLDLIRHSQRSHIFHVNRWLTTLYRKIRRLQALLDDSPQKSSQEEMNSLETRIAELATMIEGLVELNALERIPSEPKGFMTFGPSNMTPNYEISKAHLVLEVAVAEIDFVVEYLLKDRQGLKCVLPKKYSPVAGSSKHIENTNNSNLMVGFDEDMMALKDQLAGYASKLQTIPIVGMGGSGKTTLAMNLYNDSLIVHHFDVRIKATISQTYAIGDVARSLLEGIGVATNERGIQDLMETLYKNLKGRRYLILLDDMWSIEVWDDLRRIFPDDANGSRIIITTRIGDLAEYASDMSSPHKMHLLDVNKSWDLICHKVFSQKGCTLEYRELEDIGKVIARNCKGLPLAISVIGGLLANSSITQDFWEYVPGNVNSITLESDQHCYEILSLSYNHLPNHLRFCFLYFGGFPEGYELSTTKLVNLWIAEGILKPIRSKTPEEVAQEYLNELIDRNLIIVSQKRSNGKAKSCIMHDLLREFCIREAKKNDFLHIINRFDQQSSSNNVNITPRLLSIHRDILNDDDITDDVHDILGKSAAHTTTLLCTSLILCAMPFYRSFAFLKVLDFLETRFSEFPLDICGLVALRYLALSVVSEIYKPPSSIMSQLWKLQILLIRCLRPTYMPGPNHKILFMTPKFFGAVFLPSEILQMANLRYLQMKMCVLPPIERNDPIILKELVKLSTVLNFKCTEEVLKKFPNLRKLGIYFSLLKVDDWSIYHLKNLARLSKLEELKCDFLSTTLERDLLPNLSFPRSLKKLTLSGSSLFWKDMTIIGSLPLLEVLKLKGYAFNDAVWEVVEGEFCRLKFLQIESANLVRWVAESMHFPSLKYLKIEDCPHLEEIPSSIGDIGTLETIVINNSSSSAIASAWQILEEQQSMGNYVLQVHSTHLRSLEERSIAVSVTDAALRAHLDFYVFYMEEAGYASSEIKDETDALQSKAYDLVTGETSGMTILEKTLVGDVSYKLSKEGIDENSTVYVDVLTDGPPGNLICRVKKNGQLVEILM